MYNVKFCNKVFFFDKVNGYWWQPLLATNRNNEKNGVVLCMYINLFVTRLFQIFPVISEAGRKKNKQKTKAEKKFFK